MSSGNILMQHSTTSKSGQLMYQNAPTKWLLNRHFILKLAKLAKCVYKKKKSSPTLHQKRKIYLLGETGNITTGRKRKGKEGKKNRRKNSHIPGFKLLIVKRMQKKKPYHAVSKNPVSNYWQHICGNHGLWRIIKSWFCLACLNNKFNQARIAITLASITSLGFERC